MSSDSPRDDQTWYRLGYALERARQAVAPGNSEPHAAPRIPSTPPSDRGSINPFVEVGAGWLERQVAVNVQRWVGRRARTPWLGALVGATVELAAATLIGLLRAEQTVRHSEGEQAGDGSTSVAPVVAESGASLPPPPRLLVPDPLGTAARGAAHGLIYGGLLASAPGPPLAKGLAYGVARYLAAEGGGLMYVLGPVSPHRAVPLLHTMVAPEDANEPLVAHLIQGVALATIYGSSPERSGTNPGSVDGRETD